MAGYSGTALAKKLGIKEGYRVLVLHAPASFVRSLELPEDVTSVRSLAGKSPFDVAALFTESRADLEQEFARIAERLQPAGGLWVCWPKKTSCLKTDLTEDRVREVGLACGLVDNKVCAIDETWSGLRFVIRAKDRARHGAGQ